MTDWFRSWHGAPTDPKWLGIARKASVAAGIAVAVAWSLMDRASQAEDRGSIEGYDADGLAYFFGCEPEQVVAIVAAMTDKGMIIDGRFSNWEKRQPKREDDSAQRVREHRQRKATQRKRDVTQRNAPDTDTDTDTDTDISSLRSEQPRALDPDFLASRLQEAVGEKIHPHGAIVVGPVMELLTAGADLELDVLPAVRAAAAKLRQPARSWSYFVPIIQDAMDRRKSAGTWEKAPPPTGPPVQPRMTAHQQRQKAAMEAFEKFGGVPRNDEFTGNTIDIEERDFSPH